MTVRRRAARPIHRVVEARGSAIAAGQGRKWPRNALQWKIWLPFQDTSKTILIFVSEEARKTISRYRALARNSLLKPAVLSHEFATDSPLPLPREPTHGVRKRDRDRKERAKSAVAPKLSLRERAVLLVRERGEVRTKDLTDVGIPRCYLSRMCDEGLLLKVSHGRYREAT